MSFTNHSHSVLKMSLARRARVAVVPVISVLCLIGASAPAFAEQTPGAALARAPAMSAPRAAPAVVSPAPEPTMSNCPNGMSDLVSPHFRVWACIDADSAEDQEHATEMLEAMYKPMTDLMGAPLKDNSADGEHGRIDVYLVHPDQVVHRFGHTVDLATLITGGAVGATTQEAYQGPAGCRRCVSSGFIVALRPEDTSSSLNSTLVHEFFHVLQYAYNTTMSCRRFWFDEASATWAEWWFAPATANKEVYQWIPDFQKEPGVSLTDSAGRSPYSDWLWPLFMQQQAGGPSIIADAWKAIGRAGAGSCDTLNSAISSQLPFYDNFANFAVENFDHELPNLATKAREWPTPAFPVTFDRNYPSFTHSARPTVPGEFPEVLPRLEGSTSLFSATSAYPWSRTVEVNLPPLSAQYTKITLAPAGVAHGGSVDFDFSGLSPATDLDVNLLAADDAPSRSAINDGKWERIDVALSNLGDDPAHANICLNADGTKRAVLDDGKPGDPVGGSYFYVIIDDNGISGKPVTGSFTVTQRDTCATALSGDLTVDSTVEGAQTTTAHISADLSNNCAHCDGPAAWQVTGTWSAKYTYPMTNCTITASGSGRLRGNDFPTTYGVLGESYLSVYQNPYSTTPYIPGAFLSTETGTANGCGISGPVPLQAGFGCPDLFGGPNALGGWYQSNGTYTAKDASVTFDCHVTGTGEYLGYDDAITGTLTATDPVRCGLWPYCASGPGESSAAEGTSRPGGSRYPAVR